MTLDQVIQTVSASSVQDWHCMHTQTVYGWSTHETSTQIYTEPKTHTKLAVFRPDIDISLVMDATVQDPFEEQWTESFPDQHAASVSVQLRYRGAIVYEWVCVAVDGARYLLPLPDSSIGGRFSVPSAKMPVARFLFALYGVGGVQDSLDDVLARAGIAIV